MDIETMAAMAMQGLLANGDHDAFQKPEDIAKKAIEYAVALQAELEELTKSVSNYESYKARIPTDDRLWQSSKNGETSDAE